MKKSFGLAVAALLAIGFLFSAARARGFQAADSRIQIKLDVSDDEFKSFVLLHHVGLASIEAETNRLLSNLSPNVHSARGSLSRLDFPEEAGL
jgi:hypothetical protein